jgi:DNA polymerase-3 subunit delta
MLYKDFIKHIATKSLPQKSVYSFSGNEDLLKENGIALLKEYLAGTTGEVINFRPDTFSSSGLLNELYAMPFTKGKRLVILAVTGAIREEFENTLKDTYLPNPSKYSILIIKSGEPLKLPEANILTIECIPFLDYELPQWIISRFNSLGKTINQPAAKLLVQYTGNDLSLIGDIIQKVNLFSGNRKNIEESDINSLASVGGKEGELKKLTDYIRDKDTSRALEEADRLLANGEPVEKIIGWIGGHFRYSSSGNKRDQFAKLIEADIAIKTDLLSDDLALKRLIVQITRL